MTALRLTPTFLFGSRRSAKLIERNLYVYKHAWMILFSGTFFPVSSLPPVLQSVAWFTPLYHGVSLTRGLSLGTISADPLAAVVDVLFLSAFVIVGTYFAIRTIRARLVRG